MKYDNIDTFFANEKLLEPVDMELTKLLLFASDFNRDKRRIFNDKYPSIKKIEDNYIFAYKDKKYNFGVFSDRKLQEYDIKILKNIKLRREKKMLRILKLVCSMDLINPRLVVGKSKMGIFELLIIYQEKGVERVIDYASNLEMNKKDYYELFEVREYNVLDKLDLYNLYYTFNKLTDYDYLLNFLLFSKEMLNDMGKSFSFLVDKYDWEGFNMGNYLLFGDNADSLFFQSDDVLGIRYKKIQDELNDFTFNQNQKSKHIRYLSDKKKYQFKDMKFGTFTFDLLSDLFLDCEIKQELLSNERYGKCHENAIRIANCLGADDLKDAYIVGGKLKYNEIDYFFHSWIEIERGTNSIVIDFNHNLVMNREKYYKLYEVQVVNKTHISQMNEIVTTVYNSANFGFHPFLLVYLGKEIMNDLNKNIKILKKRIND